MRMSWRNPTSTSDEGTSLSESAISQPIIPAISAVATRTMAMLPGRCHHGSTTSAPAASSLAAAISSAARAATSVGWSVTCAVCQRSLADCYGAVRSAADDPSIVGS
jgi:hypothetical protein